MKTLAAIFSLIVLTVANDLATLRQKFISAPESAKVTEELYSLVEKVSDDSSDNTVVAYKAAALTLRAKHEKGLMNKKNLFKQGATLLEEVLKRDADNYEAHVLRLSIQENAPAITGYHGQIENDKKFIIKYYSSQKADLKAFTQGFVKISKSFTKEEKASF
ncbi:hypothetical protein ACLI1A_18700 [Flavobacterium sp. RHBU_3]|uniref:hypothetical protein n=1 Tax=Flavobacterium sp. RHBU_3 TaxID=3391184 RepID=UPI003984FDF1